MSYRGSLLARIAGTVLIAFVWFTFLLAYLTFFSTPVGGMDLTPPIIAGVADAAAMGILWAVWFLRDRRGF